VKTKVFSIKAKGWDHIILNRVCQDSVKSYTCDDYSVAAVADGHGASLHFRSDKGSEYAVNCAVKNLKRFHKKIAAVKRKSPEEYKRFTESLSETGGEIASGIVKRIHDDWLTCVYNDLERHPFEVTEYEELPQEYIEAYTGGNKQYYTVAYGTTLACFSVCEDFWIGLQLGDGNCVSIYKDGRVTEDVPKDESYMRKNVTHSMCGADAKNKFRHYISTDLPEAVYAVTDGITNSFNCEYDDKELLSFIKKLNIEMDYGDFSTNVRKLKKYIYTLSEDNSGDDVSVAGIIVKEEKSVR
jgi:hypothetical protein